MKKLFSKTHVCVDAPPFLTSLCVLTTTTSGCVVVATFEKIYFLLFLSYYIKKTITTTRDDLVLNQGLYIYRLLNIAKAPVNCSSLASC